MLLRSVAVALCALLLCAGCGTDEGSTEAPIIGDGLTIYSSLPLTGPLAPVSRDMVRAEKLALREAGGRAGSYNVGYVSLDSADPETGRWDAGRVAANARRAVQTTNTIAYLGELESGASTISVPILNEAGVLQVSPRDTYGGLTTGGAVGEPDRYYPSGVRNFLRLVPDDDRQAELLVQTMRDRRVRRLIVADDGSLSGRRLADRVARRAQAAGIDVVARRGGDAPRADALFYGGGYSPRAVAVLRRAHARAPRMQLYAGDDLALARELPDRLGAAAYRLTLTAIDAEARTAFERRFTAVYGAEPDRRAVLGYRAMKLALSAIRAAGDDASSRREVIRRARALVGRPRADFALYEIDEKRVVRVRPPM